MFKKNSNLVTASAVACAGIAAGSAHAATTTITSVEDIDFTNVIKAYDFTGSNSIASNGTSFVISGVTFTRHNWQLNGPLDDMTMVSGGHGSADNQGSGAPNISAGGTATDQANLNELLDWWNIGGGQDNSSVVLSIAVPDGTYNIQYLSGMNNNRENELFDIDAGDIGSGNEVSLGAYSGGGGNYLISGTAVATGGTLDLKIFGTPGPGDGRPVMSGLIISIPEPSSLALLGLGGLLVARRRRA